MGKLDQFGFPKMFKYTVTKENFPILATTLYYISKIGIEWFQIKPYNRIEVPEVDERFELEPEQVLDMSRMLLKFKVTNPDIKVDLLPLCYEFLVDSNIEMSNLSPCNCGQGPRGYLVIDPNGDIKICGAYPLALGNIEVDSLNEIWYNHPLLKDVRDKKDKPRPEECKECGHWDKCSKTDCHSATFAKYGNFEYANPQCPLVGVKTYSK
jgi:radical SAM protein with 4Fe4S-binding SPASM domain